MLKNNSCIKLAERQYVDVDYQHPTSIRTISLKIAVCQHVHQDFDFDDAPRAVPYLDVHQHTFTNSRQNVPCIHWV